MDADSLPEGIVAMQGHCIFDLDGTLFDSSSQIAKAVDSTRKKFGLEQLPTGYSTALIGLPAIRHFDDFEGPYEEKMKLVSDFRRNLMHEIEVENVIFPGVLRLLDNLRERGYFLSVATTKPSYLAEWTIKHSKLHGHFQHIQGTDEFKPKPDPEVILRCMRNVGQATTFMFGDREEDVIAANAAGAVSVGVAQSTHSTEVLAAAGAVYVFKSFVDFEGIQGMLLAEQNS